VLYREVAMDLASKETQTDRRAASKDAEPVAQDAARASNPTFLEALLADARVAAAFRGERPESPSRFNGVLQAVRLMMVSDAFFAQAAYRLKARMQALGIPVLPWIAHRVAMMSAQVSISDAAVLHPGVFIPHGQVVIQGIVVVHPGAVIHPWTTIGLIGAGVVGPTIGPRASVGTGAKVLGPISVGANARVGANAVVLNDVPPNTTVVGMPAKVVVD
jgi:serine acetyltransferase